GQCALLQQLAFTGLVRMHHTHDDVLGAGHQVHGTAHALHHLTGYLPVGDITRVGHFHGTEHGKLHVLSADHGEAGTTIEDAATRQQRHGLLTGIDQVSIFFAFVGEWSHTKDPVLALEHHVHPKW